MNLSVMQFFKKEGLVILLITLLGYGVALSYELGYAIYFSFDTEFIQIDIRAIYNGIINVFSYLLIALVLVTVFRQKKSNEAQKIIQFIIYIFLIGTLSSPMIPKVIFANLATTFVICAGIFILIFSYTHLASKDSLAIPVLIGIGCLLLITISTIVGISRASMETGFNAFKYNNSEYAIIRIYNGNIVGIKIENKNLSHDRKIYIPSNAIKEMTLRSFEIRSKPGLLNYKNEYKPFPKKSLGDLILNDSQSLDNTTQ